VRNMFLEKSWTDNAHCQRIGKPNSSCVKRDYFFICSKLYFIDRTVFFTTAFFRPLHASDKIPDLQTGMFNIAFEGQPIQWPSTKGLEDKTVIDKRLHKKYSGLW
jgi:hypothetical protein